MKRNVIFLILFLYGMNAYTQHIHFVNSDGLTERFKTGGDTVFIVNFWATWCGPCVEELPNFEKLRSNFKDEKIKILLVSVDFTSQVDKRLRPFVIKQKFKSDICWMNEKDQQAYIDKIDTSWSGAIPATLFIKGNNRKFFEKQLSYAELLNEYLNIKKS